MQARDVRDSVAQLKRALEENGYSKGRIRQFSSTTNQLLEFMGMNGIQEYSMDVDLRFMGEHYGFKAEETLSHINQGRILDLTMLSEFQLHGTYTVRHRNRNYHIPEPFRPATEQFLTHRRFAGIVERNMGTISLYLERFSATW